MRARIVRRKGFLLLLTVLSVSLFLTACSSDTASNSAAGTPAQTEAQNSGAADNTDVGMLGNFTSTDINNNEVNQEVWQGHTLTMINVWATFCGNCLREMPELAYLQDKYAAQGLQIIGIPADIADRSGNVDAELLASAQEIIAQTGADYLQIVPSPTLDEVLLHGINAVPTTVMVDAAGRQIGQYYVGAHSQEQWSDIIDELLEQQTGKS